MKNKLFTAIICLFSLTLAGCGDGVPKIDDPAKPVVDGKAMTTNDFIGKYCIGKRDNPTCIKVVAAYHKESTRGKINKW